MKPITIAFILIRLNDIIILAALVIQSLPCTTYQRACYGFEHCKDYQSDHVTNSQAYLIAEQT